MEQACQRNGDKRTRAIPCLMSSRHKTRVSTKGVIRYGISLGQPTQRPGTTPDIYISPYKFNINHMLRGQNTDIKCYPRESNKLPSNHRRKSMMLSNLSYLKRKLGLPYSYSHKIIRPLDKKMKCCLCPINIDIWYLKLDNTATERIDLLE